MNQDASVHRLPESAAAPSLTAARVMLETFARRGVRAAFGIPGGLVSPLYDALNDVHAIRLVNTRHEGMAAFAAMGHAIMTGEPALVLVTSGPGFTNALTGIASALLEELPLIAIAGEVPTTASGRGALQDAGTNAIDAVAMARTVTRWSARVESAAAMQGAAEQAVRVASGGHGRRGPVFLSIPLDVGSAIAPRARLLAPSSPPAAPRPDASACAAAARALVGAKRPLIVAGNGARHAHEALRELAERLAIPVVTTPHAKGVFPESSPLSLGGIGLGANPAASAYLDRAPDVTVVVGSKLGDYATNGWAVRLAGSVETIQIDREPGLVGRNYPVTLGIVGDADACLRAIHAALPRDVAVPTRAALPEAPAPAPEEPASAPLRPRQILEALQRAFPDAVWAVDQGEHCAYALRYLKIDDPDAFHTMVGLASMGSGIGVGIGARHADGRRTVVAVCGDGGFAMHAGEILTCVEHGIDLLLVVFNDGRWNMVHHGFEAVYGRRPDGLPQHVADLAGVAESFGALGVRAEVPADLAPERLRELVGHGRPVVLDVRFDAGEGLSVASRSASLSALRGTT